MQFKPELAEKILKGEKTQTRRIVKSGEKFVNGWIAGKKGVVTDARIKWITGQTYAIQPGRGKPAIGRFKLLDIRQERVQDITEGDAKAEGVEPFNTPAFGPLYKPAFVGIWNEINGPDAFGGNPKVWVLTFEVAQ